MRPSLTHPAATPSNKVGVFCRSTKKRGATAAQGGRSKSVWHSKTLSDSTETASKSQGGKRPQRLFCRQIPVDVGQQVCDERVVDGDQLLRSSWASRLRTQHSPESPGTSNVESVSGQDDGGDASRNSAGLSSPPQAAAMSVAVRGQPRGANDFRWESEVMANGLYCSSGPCDVPGAPKQWAELASLRSHGIEGLRVFPAGLARPPKEVAIVRKKVIESGRIQRKRCEKFAETGAPLHKNPVVKLLQEALSSRVSGGSKRAIIGELTNPSASPGSFWSGFLGTAPKKRNETKRNETKQNKTKQNKT